MKFLGKYIIGIALALLLGTQSVTAQTVRLHMKGGETLEYNCADVDSLTFIPAEKPSPKFQLAVSDIGIASATLSRRGRNRYLLYRISQGALSYPHDGANPRQHAFAGC